MVPATFAVRLVAFGVGDSCTVLFASFQGESRASRADVSLTIEPYASLRMGRKHDEN